MGAYIMQKINKFIFVSGPSESGKSSGINYIVDTFPQIKHLKIRNVYRELYEKSGSDNPYDDWREQEKSRDLENHWKEFLQMASQIAKGYDIIIMDTLYSPKDVVVLHNILGDKLSVLYIDAPLNSRVLREYNRLRTDSPYSDRKADLSITLEDVEAKTLKKDTLKKSEGAFDYPNLMLHFDGSISMGGEGKQFVYIINNNQDEESYHRKLDEYVHSLC